MQSVLAVVLAGGKGSRLEPLTRDRSKPAVPFGGCFRIIDFTLSNCLNSGIRRILVVTQYKAASLERHIELGWHFLPSELGEFVHVRPPEQRVDENWYLGTADAIYQNIYTIEKVRPKYIVVLSGDHVYRMDYSRFISEHIACGADASIACLPVPLEAGKRFGVMQTDENRRIVQFREKPSDPDPMLGHPDQCLASMGIYVFNTEFLFERLCLDANDPDSHRDFGKDIIPSIIHDSHIMAWPFNNEETGCPAYWRDVGTLDSYFDANMDLIAVQPELNLYDDNWPIRTWQPPLPPPKFVFNDYDHQPPRVGSAVDSLICSGTIISGGRVERCILSPRVRVHSYADVRNSILFEGVEVGRNCRIERAIIDKGVRIPDGVTIGMDHASDLARGLTVSDRGVVAVASNVRF
ncbi:MAG TPA: glucose-1-phosphate adenylyltransferase [Planctomycetaceae bacterium]|nr:glucose-1-phosphate adenylyltransferase [Planctomycetaceae bacterium]